MKVRLTKNLRGKPQDSMVSYSGKVYFTRGYNYQLKKGYSLINFPL